MSNNESIIDLTDIIEPSELNKANETAQSDQILENEDTAAPSLDDLLGSLNTLREKSLNPSEEIIPMSKKISPLESPNTDILFDEFDVVFNDALEKSPIAKLKQEKYEENNEIDEDSLKFILEQSLPDEDEDIEDNKIKSLDELDDLLDSIMLEDTEDIDLMEELEQANMADNFLRPDVERELNNSNPKQAVPENSTANVADTETSDSKKLDNFEQILEENSDEGIDFEDLDKLLSSIELPEQPEYQPNPEALKILENLVTPNVELLDLEELELPSQEAPEIKVESEIQEDHALKVEHNEDILKEELEVETLSSEPTVNSELDLVPEAKIADPRLEELLINFATQKSVLELMEKKILALAEPKDEDLESISAKFSSELEEKFEAKLNILSSENIALKNTINLNQERLLKLTEQNAKLELIVEGLLTKQLHSQSTIENLQTQTNEILNQSSELQADLVKLNTAQEILLLDLEQKVASTAAKIIQEEIAQLIQDE